MALWKRFGNKQAGKEVFHSSGMLTSPDADTLGSTSSETFEQRRHVERNRQVIGGYREAGLMHNYKREAHGHRMGQQKVAPHAQHSYASDSTATRQHERRIDIINPRQGSVKRTSDAKAPANTARQRVPISDIRKPSRGAQPVAKPIFHEPSGRRYNPYQ